MIRENVDICPLCNGKLKYYDTVKRIVLYKYRAKKKVYIRRFKCNSCKKTHRELPDFIYPFKFYDADIIQGFVEGLITYDTPGFEDYPCETTIMRWIKIST